MITCRFSQLLHVKSTSCTSLGGKLELVHDTSTPGAQEMARDGGGHTPLEMANNNISITETWQQKIILQEQLQNDADEER